MEKWEEKKEKESKETCKNIKSCETEKKGRNEKEKWYDKINDEEIWNYLIEARDEEFQKFAIKEACRSIVTVFPEQLQEEKEKKCISNLASELSNKEYINKFLEEEVNAMEIAKHACLNPIWSIDEGGKFSEEGYKVCMKGKNFDIFSDFWRQKAIEYLKPQDLPMFKVDEKYQENRYIEFELMCIHFAQKECPRFFPPISPNIFTAS